MAARRGIGGAPGVARRARSPRGARALRARARASAAVVSGEEFDAVVARALEAPDVAAARDMCQAALPALEAGRCKREARKVRLLRVRQGFSGGAGGSAALSLARGPAVCMRSWLGEAPKSGR